jgi:hypothetical protein
LIKSLSIITHSKSNTNPSKISTINQIEITRNHQEFLFKAVEIHRKTSLGFIGKSLLEVAGFPARTAGNRYWDHFQRWPLEDRVWVSSEGRVSAPVLLGFGSFWVRRVLSSLRRFLEQRPPEIGPPVVWPSPGSPSSSVSLLVSLSVSLSPGLCLSQSASLSLGSLGLRREERRKEERR